MFLVNSLSWNLISLTSVNIYITVLALGYYGYPEQMKSNKIITILMSHSFSKNNIEMNSKKIQNKNIITDRINQILVCSNISKII